MRSASCSIVCAALGAVLVGSGARPAGAEPAPIVDRNFAIDLYDGVAIGDTAMVGMGGAGAALITGTGGALINPSAIAVRSTTDQDQWGWGYHFDFLTGRFSSDYDNNGVATGEASGAALVTLGVGLRYGNWSLGATTTLQDAPVPGSSPELTATANRTRVVLGVFLPRYDLAVGAGIQRASFSLDEGQESLFEVFGTGLVAGATWLPAGESLRIGGALDLPIASGQVTTSACDPMSCRGYILPGSVEAPGRIAGGVAYRLGPTAWNQPIAATFRDERALTLAADLVVTGATANGYGIEAFGMQQLQRSGRHVALSLRGGAEVEWLPGRLRLRAGAYWEPARFDDVAGRMHGTAGVEVGGVDFHLWGPRRLRLSLTGDVAARYRNVALSIGFWH